MFASSLKLSLTSREFEIVRSGVRVGTAWHLWYHVTRTLLYA